jgi:hypothetical protein
MGTIKQPAVVPDRTLTFFVMVESFLWAQLVSVKSGEPHANDLKKNLKILIPEYEPCLD